jgi:hypothetical protein
MFSEQDVDRELKAALSVSPSPDFEARVLRRVEADRPSHWRADYGWLAAAATVVIAAGVFYALNRTSPAVAPPPPAQVVEQAPRTVMPQADAPVHNNASEPSRVATVRASQSTARIASRSAEPEVIVPVNQMEAVRRLVRAVNEGLIQLPAEPVRGPMPPPATLDVAPLVVDPIAISPVDSVAQAPAPSIRGLK